MKHIKNEGLEIVVKNNPKTPRSAICCVFSIDTPTELSGVSNLTSRLLLRGTNKRTAEELSLELQDNGIELSTESKRDYLKIDTVFLNQDFDLAVEILEDIIKNSTFKELDKEIFKLKAEIPAVLDSSTSKLSDSFTRTIFKNHHYENSVTKTLEDIDKIDSKIVNEFWGTMLNSKKVIVAVGDFEDEEKISNELNKKFAFLNKYTEKTKIEDIKNLKESKVVKIEKNSANQAHVIQGWITDSINTEDYPKIIVMNNLMGSSGLSSRLFYELRDKQGLAYTVRSSYEALRHAGVISFYIGTTPNNIRKSLDGFRTEIEKLQNNLPTEEELQGAKENVLGRLAYFSQTNEQQAHSICRDIILGRPLDFKERYTEMINSVTREDLSEMAKKYLSGNDVIAVIAPSDYLEF
ncbi:MAG: insulinase family protein [Cyanobacteria bacterium SIG30]|nr:insulinase family protein [Cyanobacteria bacterium SIG30]